MHRITYFILLLLVMLGCGPSKRELTREVDALKDRLTGCKLTIEDRRQKEKEIARHIAELMVVPPPAPPPTPEFLVSWTRSFPPIASALEQAFQDHDHTIDTRNGVLVLSFSSDLFFERDKAALTEQGGQIIDRLLLVFKEQQSRDLHVTVRSMEPVEAAGKPLKRVKTVKEVKRRYGLNRKLSAERSLAISEALESRGIHPINIVAAGYGIDPAETQQTEESVVEIAIHPLDDEIPIYPQF